MNLYCCANYLMCQRILILRIGHSRFAIYLCVGGLVGVYAPLCASVVNPPNLVAITEKNQAVPSSALRFFYFNRIRYTMHLYDDQEKQKPAERVQVVTILSATSWSAVQLRTPTSTNMLPFHLYGGRG